MLNREFSEAIMFRAVLAAFFAVALYNLYFTAEPVSVLNGIAGMSQEVIMAALFAILVKPWVEQEMEG